MIRCKKYLMTRLLLCTCAISVLFFVYIIQNSQHKKIHIKYVNVPLHSMHSNTNNITIPQLKALRNKNQSYNEKKTGISDAYTFVCGKNYKNELVVRPWAPCAHSLPQLMLHGNRKEPGKGRFDIGPSCAVKWFSPHEACDLFGRLGHVAFIGDSLIRQLALGVATVLTGNFRSGGLNVFTPVDYWENCDCEHQWQCFKEPVGMRFQSKKAPPQFTICPLWTRDHISWNTDLTSLQKHRPLNDSLIIISDASALHTSLDWKHLEKEMLLYKNLARKFGGDLVPMTVHWPGPNKPVEFQKSQGEEILEIYHENLRRWANKHDLWVFESYQFTKGEWSRDGVHYDDLNIALSQLLLNYLQRMLESKKLRLTHEFNALDPLTYRYLKPEDKNIPVFRGGI